MAQVYIVARPTTKAPLRYADLLDDSSSEWHNKARDLRMRRWRALKRSTKTLPKSKWNHR